MSDQTPFDAQRIAYRVLQELVEGFADDEYDGRENDIATRLDHLSIAQGDEVIREMRLAVSDE